MPVGVREELRGGSPLRQALLRGLQPLPVHRAEGAQVRTRERGRTCNLNDMVLDISVRPTYNKRNFNGIKL